MIIAGMPILLFIILMIIKEIYATPRREKEEQIRKNNTNS